MEPTNRVQILAKDADIYFVLLECHNWEKSVLEDLLVNHTLVTTLQAQAMTAKNHNLL